MLTAEVGIDVEFSKEQTKAIDYLQDKITKRVLYGGQAGGGKSFLISMWSIQMCLQYEGIRGYRKRGFKESLKTLF